MPATPLIEVDEFDRNRSARAHPSRALRGAHTMAAPSAACERCRFSHRSDNYIIREQRNQIECRANPPIMVLRQSSCAKWWESGWPEVNRDASCGRFSALGTPPASPTERPVLPGDDQ